MSGRTYSNEEKNTYVEEFKASGLKQTTFAREKGIPDATFRGWLKLERQQSFGEISLKNAVNINANSTSKPNISNGKTIIFVKDDIKLELREGFDKQLLKKIVEVLISDT